MFPWWLRPARLAVYIATSALRSSSSADVPSVGWTAIPMLAFVDTWQQAAVLITIERTGKAIREGDSFWTWRQAMYAFLDRATKTEKD